MTPKGKDYQIELLSNELKTGRRKLRNLISLFEDLLKTKNAERVTIELKQLEECLSQLQSVGQKLCELLEGEERCTVTETLDEEKENVLKVKNAVNEWLAVQPDDDKKSKISRRSRESSRSKHSQRSKKEPVSVDEGENGPDAKSKTRMMINLMRKQSKLEGQMGIVEDLLKCKGTKMVTREAVKLDTILKEMTSTFPTLGVKLSPEESQKVEDIVKEGELKVEILKESVKRHLEMMDEDKRTEVSSRGASVKRDFDHFSLLSGRSRLSCPTKTVGKRSRRKRSSSDAGMLNKTGYSNQEKEKDDRSGDGDQGYTTYLLGKFEELQKKCTGQNSMINDLLETNDRGMMRKEVENLDKFIGQLESIAKSLMSELPPDRANNVQDALSDGETVWLNTKGLVAKWMRRQEETEKRSLTSKASRKSAASKASKGSSLSNKHPNHDDGENQETVIRETKRNQERLEQQRQLVGDLLKGRDSETMNREVTIMEQLLEGVMKSVQNLSQLLADTESKKWWSDVARKEEMKVFELKKTVVKWMVEQAEAEDKSSISESSRTSTIADIAEDGLRVVTSQQAFQRTANRIPIDQLKKDFERTMVRLSHQITLVEDLLKASDTGMMNHEIQSLDRSYDDMIAAASLLRECSPPE